MAATPICSARATAFPQAAPEPTHYGRLAPVSNRAAARRQIVGPDYFNVPADNGDYNRGPIMNLINSPSYPSGHTTYGYTGALVLALLVPERYQQMIARGAEYGNDRILMGAHYAMDVLGGRTLASTIWRIFSPMIRLTWASTLKGAPIIKDFQAAIKAARADVTTALEAACGKTIQECAREDTGRLSNPAANEAFYAATQTYNLPVVYPQNANGSRRRRQARSRGRIPADRRFPVV